MITLGREKLVQHMLLGVHEATQQYDVVVLDELGCPWPAHHHGREPPWRMETKVPNSKSDLQGH